MKLKTTIEYDASRCLTDDEKDEIGKFVSMYLQSKTDVSKYKMEFTDKEIINRMKSDLKYFSRFYKGSTNKEGEEQVETKKEMVNHPEHYNVFSVEVIDMMERIWGKETTSYFCEMNSFKYRMRMGYKHENGETALQDLKKAKWYESKAKELRGK